jgi:hypothetical protein
VDGEVVGDLWDFVGSKEGSASFLKKSLAGREAKNFCLLRALAYFGPEPAVRKSWMPAFAGVMFDGVVQTPAGAKVFCFFFSKKKRCLKLVRAGA